MPTLDLNQEFEGRTATFWYGKRHYCRVRKGETCLEAVTRRLKKVERCTSLYIAWQGRFETTIPTTWYIFEFVDANRDIEQGLVCIPETVENNDVDFVAMLGKLLASGSVPVL